MTTVTDNDHTGELGVLALRRMCAKAKQICREVLFRDVGVDAFVELVEDGVAQGLLVGVQVKAGSSYVKGDLFGFKSDINHARYWSRCAFPMISLIHDPVTERSAWIDLTGSCTADRFENNDYRFEVSFASQPLNEHTLVNTVIPLVRTHFGRDVSTLPSVSLDQRPTETDYEVWFRLIGVLIGPATSTAEVADAAHRLSWYMPTVTLEQEAAVEAVIKHLTDFQLLKLIGAADLLLQADAAEHVVDLLRYNVASSARLEGLLRMGAVPEELRDTAVQLVECLTEERREDLRQPVTAR